MAARAANQNLSESYIKLLQYPTLRNRTSEISNWKWKNAECWREFVQLKMHNASQITDQRSQLIELDKILEFTIRKVCLFHRFCLILTLRLLKENQQRD